MPHNIKTNGLTFASPWWQEVCECSAVTYVRWRRDGGPFSDAHYPGILWNWNGKPEDCYWGQHVSSGARTQTLICEENNTVGNSLKEVGTQMCRITNGSTSSKLAVLNDCHAVENNIFVLWYTDILNGNTLFCVASKEFAHFYLSWRN